MPGAAHETTLCLDCNYPLRGLIENRCPECGRAFDPADPRSFNNSSRALTWFDRKLLAPTGWPTFSLIALVCSGLLFLALDPGIYYMGCYIFLSGLCYAVIAFILMIRRASRDSVLPASMPRANDKLRRRCGHLFALVMCLLVLFRVPMCIGFLFAKPGLDRLVADLHNGKATMPIPPTRVGPYVVSTNGYGGDDTFFFHLIGRDGGFAYCPTKGPGGYYNTGNHGHLIGDWYWWIDD
jgi:hypothetical protein